MAWKDMAWTYLFIAGLLEIGWAVGLKYTDSFTKLVPSVLICTSKTDGPVLERVWSNAR